VKHVLVLGDQLTRSVGPLAHAEPEETTVLMIESAGLASAIPHHKQKLVLVFSAMRHFAEGLQADGFRVDYRQASDFGTGVAEHLLETGADRLTVMAPTDHGYLERLRAATVGGGAELVVVPNELWLTSEEEFDAWADGRKTLRLEYFYRAVRKKLGWLMDGDEPRGGRWNFDADNRRTPEPGHRFPGSVSFAPDAQTREVIDMVEARWPEHFGTTEGFGWPVTRGQALEALDDFLRHRLTDFGPFEDAMVESEPVLYHSLLSVPLNLGLLHPREVCERALAFAADPAHDVPLQSIEGFIRQILGWREFIRHVYRRLMPDLREANALGHDLPLPEAYWGARTGMRCVGQAVQQLQATGHTHHIQRLMVLGNFALVARVDPRELNDWFLACYVDALDWVVTPNVMGMSQFADLGSFTSKPYAASGKYVDRMSDHCARCSFDPRKTVGDDACPLNALYWDFIDHHAERWRENPRMALMVRNWERRAPEARAEILAKAASIRERLAPGADGV
jgi:deoxyribodipyrimidine photolyase-related protein